MHIIIDKYKKDITELCANQKNIEVVFNSDWDNLKAEKIKYILIADNPGQIEKEKGRYLVGPAGLSTRVYFERAFVTDFKDEVLVLNKTPIYTKITNDLLSVPKEVNEKCQSLTVEMLIELVKLLHVPVIIMGYSNGLTKINKEQKLKLKSSNVLYVFFLDFLKAIQTQKISEFFIISHFSRDSFYKANISIKDYETDSKELLLVQARENEIFLRNAHPEFFTD